METPVVFKSEGQQIVGMLHMPDRRKGKVPAVVLLHGFTGNKVEAHRLFVKMARTLSAAGMAVLRFDFRGSGDSAGDFSTMTLTGELRDARAAMKFIRRHPGIDLKRIGVLGLSMGGLIAAELMGEDRGIRAATLWAPVAHLDRLIQRDMTPANRRHLKQMGCVDDHGHAVGKGFFDDAGKHSPLKAIARTRAPVLLIHGQKDETVPVAIANEYESVLGKAGVPVLKYIVDGSDHTFASLPWETQVIGLTLQWFLCNFG